ncbi:MAG: hypothetical protein ACOC7S_01690 [Planctomycetota bacterium]
MDDQARELARAASGLRAEDYRFLETRGMIRSAEKSSPGEADTGEDGTREDTAQEDASEEDPSQERVSENSATQEENAQQKEERHEAEEESETGEDRKRRQVSHTWPEVGAELEADYLGAHYEAEVIAVPRYKSGKAIRVLNGPAAGDVERSMSGAMLTATERQREENDLGRKGVSNGWDFWSVKEEGDDQD